MNDDPGWQAQAPAINALADQMPSFARAFGLMGWERGAQWWIFPSSMLQASNEEVLPRSFQDAARDAQELYRRYGISVPKIGRCIKGDGA